MLPPMTMARTAWLFLAALSLGSCEDKAPAMAVDHCDGFNVGMPERLDIAVANLRKFYEIAVDEIEREPHGADDSVRRYQLDFEQYMAPLLSDARLVPSGLLPSKPPSTLAEATEQLAALEAALPKLHEHIEQQRTTCIAEMTADPLQGRCKTVKRKLESFSMLCTRLGGHLARYDPRAGESGFNRPASLMEALGIDLHYKARVAVDAIEPALLQFLDEVEFPFWTVRSSAEWSAAFGGALRHRRLVARIAASLAPPECGTITVECPL